MPGIGALHRRAAVKMMKREVPHGLRSVVGICCTAYVAVWPIATNFSLGPDVSFRGEAEVGRAAEPSASVESDPERTSTPATAPRFICQPPGPSVMM